MANFRQWLVVSNWSRVVPDIKDAFLRFPLPIISIIAANVAAMLAIHEIGLASDLVMGKLIFFFSYSVVALTALKLIVESRSWPRSRHAIAAVVVLLLLIIYTWLVYDTNAFLTSVYLGSALLLSLLFTPYIKRHSDQDSVWYFNYQSGVAVFFGGLASVVLGVGILILLTSLHYLFDIKIPSRTYGDIWILSWGVLFPVYVLANLSRQFDFESGSCNFPKGIRFITNYIMLPLMVAYMAILYAYFARILIQGELPRGKLTWMIAIFGTVGIATKLLAYPIRNSGTRLLKWFDRYYYYALVVPIILIALAIGVRIRDYGLTEQRYSVVLMTVWFILVTLLAIFAQKRFHIKHVPMILAVLLLVGSFGPWSAAEMSIRSQVGRFESLLTKNHLLQDGQVVRSEVRVPFTERKKLSSIADYLCANETRYRRIRPWFDTLLIRENKEDKKQKRKGKCDSLGSAGLLELMGVQYVYRWQSEEEPEGFSYSNPYMLFYKNLVNVTGFDFVGRGNSYRYTGKKSINRFELRYKGVQEKFTATRDGGKFIVAGEHGGEIVFDVGAVIRTLSQQHVRRITKDMHDRMILNSVSGNGRFKARLILDKLQGEIKPGQKPDISYMEYTLLLKFMEN